MREGPTLAAVRATARGPVRVRAGRRGVARAGVATHAEAAPGEAAGVGRVRPAVLHLPPADATVPPVIALYPPPTEGT